MDKARPEKGPDASGHWVKSQSRPCTKCISAASAFGTFATCIPLRAGVTSPQSPPPAERSTRRSQHGERFGRAPGTSPSREGPGTGDKGLKTGAIGYVSNLVIGVASTAPAYSLAATLGFVTAVAGMGLHAPAVMIISFIPMLLIAAAYNYMNKADPDCGTSFTWVTRALGPHLGWLTGWAIVAADVMVMATLAYIAGVYTFSSSASPRPRKTSST